MREQLRAASPYVSMFGFVLLLAGIIARGMANVPPNVATGTAIVGGLLFLAWPVLAWSDFRDAIGGRRARFGGNALALVAAVILGLVAVYFLGTRFYYSADLTTNKQFTLQRQTLQVLDSLASEGKQVVLTAVLGGNESPQTEQDLRRLAERYTTRSPNLRFNVIRPDRDPVAVTALAQRIQKDPNALIRTMVAESGGKSSVVYSYDEQGLTEAIIKATRPKTTQVYFTTGHGEPGEADPNGAGYMTLKRGLEREGYAVSTVTLGAMTQTLKAGDVVVVAGPTRPFQPSEVKKLRDFVFNKDTKGSVLLMLASAFTWPAGTPPDLGLESLWLPWEIRLTNDMVVDPAGQATLNNALWVLVYGDGWRFHTITKDLTSTNAVFPSSRSMTVGTPITATLTATELVRSGKESWGEKDFQSLAAQQTTPDEGEQGPLAMGVAAEGGADVGRLVLYGSAAFASDEVLGNLNLQQSFANGSLILNSVNWLAADENLISIRPTEPDNRSLKAPQNPALLWWFLVVLFPLAVLGIGVFAWWRRR